MCESLLKKYYLKGSGLNPVKAMLIDPCKIGQSNCRQLEEIWPDKQVDLTLRYRHAKSHLEEKQKSLLKRIDQWCMEYEERICALGCIGFFLGGTGPDGHIGFNIKGSDHYSTTRLCSMNIETQPAAATDMGGIETARKCHVITVALDPEATGPDTHYKVLQVISEALQIYQKRTRRNNIRIWGYRNVWHRLDPSEANIFVPVSLNLFSVMQQSFENAFLSQKDASFPSYGYDGPFSDLAQRIQVQQYQQIKTCLGREWFYNHPSPLIRATRGFVFLKEMELEEF
jgi:hypothetical protein